MTFHNNVFLIVDDEDNYDNGGGMRISMILYVLFCFCFSQIVKESYVDHTQFDKKDPHYDRYVFITGFDVHTILLTHQISHIFKLISQG